MRFLVFDPLRLLLWRRYDKSLGSSPFTLGACHPTHPLDLHCGVGGYIHIILLTFRRVRILGQTNRVYSRLTWRRPPRRRQFPLTGKVRGATSPRLHSLCCPHEQAAPQEEGRRSLHPSLLSKGSNQSANLLPPGKAALTTSRIPRCTPSRRVLEPPSG